MNAENRHSLERLSTFCDFCGVFLILIGMLVIAFDLMEQNVLHIQVGIFILAIGYASFKIGQRIYNVLIMEK